MAEVAWQSRWLGGMIPMGPEVTVVMGIRPVVVGLQVLWVVEVVVRLVLPVGAQRRVRLL